MITNRKEFKEWATKNGYSAQIASNNGKRYHYVLFYANDPVTGVVEAVNLSERMKLEEVGCKYMEMTKYGPAWVWMFPEAR